MQQIIWPSLSSEEPLAHSQWWKGAQMCSLQKIIWWGWPPENASSNSQWEKLHECGQCDKSFGIAAYLKRHLLTQCDKSFAEAGNLRQHQRAHCGERPHKCAQCNKSFSLDTNMKRRLLTHTGEKLYKCGQCDKTFGQAGNLKRHIFAHSESQKWKCHDLYIKYISPLCTLMCEWLLRMRHNHIKCMCGISCLHVSLNAPTNYLLCLTLITLITFLCLCLNIYLYMCPGHMCP